MFGLRPLRGICLWAWVSWTQKLLGKLIQDQSWPLVRLWNLDWEKSLENAGVQRHVYKKAYVHPVFKGLNSLHISFFSVVQEARWHQGWGLDGCENFRPPPHRGSNPEPSTRVACRHTNCLSRPTPHVILCIYAECKQRFVWHFRSHIAW
jgi:hypothetical protein